jgi:hypothetical protein
MNTVIIETIVSVLANLAVTLIGVAGAWLVTQIGKSQQLKTINAAVDELTNAAEQTVLELQQTVVDDLKAASADGKLTQDEITELGKKLLQGTLAKMSDSGIGVLKAANVDINAIVTGAGEALIARIKEAKSMANTKIYTVIKDGETVKELKTLTAARKLADEQGGKCCMRGKRSMQPPTSNPQLKKRLKKRLRIRLWRVHTSLQDESPACPISQRWKGRHRREGNRCRGYRHRERLDGAEGWYVHPLRRREVRGRI